MGKSRQGIKRGKKRKRGEVVVRMRGRTRKRE